MVKIQFFKHVFAYSLIGFLCITLKQYAQPVVNPEIQPRIGKPVKRNSALASPDDQMLLSVARENLEGTL